MSNIIWIIIWILIAVLALLIAFTFYIFIKRYKSKSRKQQIEKLGKAIKYEITEKMNATLSRVKLISENNSKFIGLSKRLIIQFDEVDLKLKATVNLIANLTLKSKKLTNEEFKDHKSIIELSIIDMDRMARKFEIDAQSVIQQDDFMRSELSFLHKHLRDVIDVYKTKRVFLREISKDIDLLIADIKVVEKEFDDALNAGNNNAMSQALSQLSKKVIKFARVINEGPSIQTYLLETIPKKTMQLLAMYKEKKRELNTNFSNVNFSNSFEDVKQKYKSAKQYFKNLSIDKAEERIREILKSLKVLEKMINIEIESRNLFHSSFEGTIKGIRNAFSSFQLLQKRYALIKPELLTDEIEELNDELKIQSVDVNKSLGVFGQLLSDKDLSYSSKTSRIKIILNETLGFIRKINEVETLVWNLNSKGIIIKNKFNRTVHALNGLVASLKENRIKMSTKNSKSLKNINDEIKTCMVNMEKEIPMANQEETINDLLKRISDLFVILSGDLQMAELARELIKKLSPNRSSDSSLNFSLTTAENEYLSGRYDSSLNAIIAWMEQGE